MLSLPMIFYVNSVWWFRVTEESLGENKAKDYFLKENTDSFCNLLLYKSKRLLLFSQYIWYFLSVSLSFCVCVCLYVSLAFMKG